jgi:hypothetical protein
MVRLLGAGLVLLSAACSAPPLPPSPAKLERCTKLYATWMRYGQHVTFHHTGQQARAELALQDCRQGRYDMGMAELEELLRRGRIPPPPPVTERAYRAGG